MPLKKNADSTKNGIAESDRIYTTRKMGNLFEKIRGTSYERVSLDNFEPNHKFVNDAEDSSLSTKDLNIYIKGQQILKNVSVQFPKNKITCIIGPSGCGKSTLLRTLNRLIDGTEGVKIVGNVNLGSRNLVTASQSEVIELRRHIGLVPQRPCP
ncbi:MAG: ATP-binding cassette domain-containing protein, partial [Paludibacteraceae bacterium]|nr:ATP-binding cassette domain-containing protein [Paludibacteraceae bacterium]